MTTIDQNIAIAEKVGWFPHPENNLRKLEERYWTFGGGKYGDIGSRSASYFGYSDDDIGWGIGSEPLPKYAESLDLMHEAEKIMNLKMWKKYVVMLARVIANEYDWNVQVSVPTNVLIAATAQQRSEAFLRVLTLWR